MCRRDTPTGNGLTKKVKVEDDDPHENKASISKEPEITLSRFFDVNEPWLLTPNGSFKGFFDNVPESFRVGPWNVLCCVYLFALVYWILFECLQCYNDPPKVEPSDYAYYGTDTWQWKYNAVGATWSLYLVYRTAKSPTGYGAWVTYTVQSWTMITIRHILSTLAPFVPAVAVYNEYLRFPMLLQTTIVFTLWNFALFPIVYSTMKSPKNRQAFLDLCFGFILMNLHILNLPMAVLNGVYGTPGRELNKIDFCVALVLTLQYILFYLFFLDRLGIHLYFIFSPRSPLALVSWSAFIGCIYAGFAMWKDGILQYGRAA